MSAKPQETARVTYTTQEIQDRFTEWCSLPREAPTDLPARHHAWCRYVEARDGLPPGSAIKSMPAPRDDDDQMEMFGGIH